MQQRKITFIGAGNMARAIIIGLVNNGYPSHLITVCAPSSFHRSSLTERYGVHNSGDNISSTRETDVIILAVKPQLVIKICTDLRKNKTIAGKLIISIAAGIKIKQLYMALGKNVSIIRIMPNMPSLVGQGMTGLYALANVNEQDKIFSENLVSMVGKFCWLDKEDKINSIIAITASAPAYFFLFMEAIQQQAQLLGFDVSTARSLVLQTAIGSTALAANVKDTTFATLRQSITTKGGTTAAAVEVFEQQQLINIVANAMQAVITRAKEIEKLF